MNKIIIFLIILILIVAGFYYLVYPAFRSVEVEDSLDGLVEDVPPLTSTNENSVADDETPEPAPPIPLNVSTITGTAFHPSEGVVRKLTNQQGETVLRFEDFQTIDGPMLNVYLTNDLDATEFYDLGHRKGTKGNINYVIPNDVDLTKYKYIVHWCVPFSVLFNYAEIPQ